MQPKPVFLREDGWTVELPVNFEIGIIPRDCALVAKRVEGVALYVTCAVSETTRKPGQITGIHSMSCFHLTAERSRSNQCSGMAAQIHRDIQNRTKDARTSFPAAALPEMQAAKVLRTGKRTWLS